LSLFTTLFWRALNIYKSQHKYNIINIQYFSKQMKTTFYKYTVLLFFHLSFLLFTGSFFSLLLSFSIYFRSSLLPFSVISSFLCFHFFPFSFLFFLSSIFPFFLFFSFFSLLSYHFFFIFLPILQTPFLTSIFLCSFLTFCYLTYLPPSFLTCCHSLITAKCHKL